MIVQLFGVADRVSGVVDGPHKALNESQFLRSFSDAVNASESNLSQHPEDFYVVLLGTWNDATGDIIPNEGGPKRLADGVDFVNKMIGSD